MGDSYSGFKVLHHQDQLDGIRKGYQPPPVHVQLILSDLCNHDCHFCAYRLSGYTTNELFTIGAKMAKTGHNNPVRMMPYEKSCEIIDDCREMGVKSVQLTGGGEPTVHPQHASVMEKILDSSIELAMVTNGQILKPDALACLSRATWVRVSIDAGCSETYASIRRISAENWRRTWNNVRRIADCKSATTELGCGFVVTKENWKEIGEFLIHAKEHGADNARISAFFQNDDEIYYGDQYGEILDHLRSESDKHRTASFAIYNNFADRLSDMRRKNPEYTSCGYQKFTTYIGADLNVYRCCNTAYSKTGLVGSLKGKRFRQLWCQAKSNQNSFDPSQHCQRCQFNHINQVIEYATLESPKHVNYP